MHFFEEEENSHEITPVLGGKFLIETIASVLTFESPVKLKNLQVELRKYVKETDSNNVVALNECISIWVMVLCEYRMIALDKHNGYTDDQLKKHLSNIDNLEKNIAKVNSYSKKFMMYYFPRFMYLIHLFRAQVHQRLKQYKEAVDELEIATAYSVEYNGQDKSINLRRIRNNPFDVKNNFEAQDNKSSLSYIDDYFELTCSKFMTRMLGQVKGIHLSRLVNLLAFRAYRHEKFSTWSKRAKKNLPNGQSDFCFRIHAKDLVTMYDAIHKKVVDQVPQLLSKACLLQLNDYNGPMKEIHDDLTILLSDVTCCYLRCKLENVKQSDQYQSALKLYIFTKSVQLFLIGLSDIENTDQHYIMCKKIEHLTKNELLDNFEINDLPLAPLLVTFGCFVTTIFSKFQNTERDGIAFTSEAYIKYFSDLTKNRNFNRHEHMQMFWLIKFFTVLSLQWFEYDNGLLTGLEAILLTLFKSNHPMIHTLITLTKAAAAKDEKLAIQGLDDFDKILARLQNNNNDQENNFQYQILELMLLVDTTNTLNLLIKHENKAYSPKAAETKFMLTKLFSPPKEEDNIAAVSNIKETPTNKMINRKKHTRNTKKKKKKKKQSLPSSKKQTEKQSSQKVDEDKKALRAIRRELHQIYQNINKFIKEKKSSEAEPLLGKYRKLISQVRLIEHLDAGSTYVTHNQNLERVERKINNLKRRENVAINPVPLKKNSPKKEKKKDPVKKKAPVKVPSKKAPPKPKIDPDKAYRVELKKAWNLLDTNPESALEIYKNIETKVSDRLKASVQYGIAFAHKNMGEFNVAVEICSTALKQKLKTKMRQNFQNIQACCEEALSKNGHIKILSPLPQRMHINPFGLNFSDSSCTSNTQSIKCVEGKLVVPSQTVQNFFTLMGMCSHSLFILRKGAAINFIAAQCTENKDKIPSVCSKHYTLAIGLTKGQLLTNLNLQDANIESKYIRVQLPKGYIVDILPLFEPEDKRSPFELLRAEINENVDLACHTVVYDIFKNCYFCFDDPNELLMEPLKLRIPSGQSPKDLKLYQCLDMLNYSVRFDLNIDHKEVVKSVLIQSLEENEFSDLMPCYVLELFCTGQSLSALKQCLNLELLALIFPTYSTLTIEQMTTHLTKMDSLLSTSYAQSLFFDSSTQNAVTALLAMMLYPVMKVSSKSCDDLNDHKFQQKLETLINEHAFVDKRLNLVHPIVSIWKDALTNDSVFIAANIWLKLTLNAEQAQHNHVYNI